MIAIDASSRRWGDGPVRLSTDPIELLDMATTIKNQDIQWTTFDPDPYSGQTRAQVHEAFTHKRAEKRLLPAGMKICRLHAYGGLAPGMAEFSVLTPWWSPYDEYDYDAGIENRQKMAANLGVSTRELSRIVMAVKEDWNSLAYLWVTSLKVSVFAFFGGVAGQDRIGKNASTQQPNKSYRDTKVEKSSGSKGLTGGNSQFYIPKLRLSDISSSQFIPLK